MAHRTDRVLSAMSMGLTTRGFPQVEETLGDMEERSTLGALLGQQWSAKFPFKHDNDPNEFAQLLYYVLRDLSAEQSVIHDSLPEYEKERPKFDDPDLYEKRAQETEFFLLDLADATGLKDSEIAQIYSQVADKQSAILPGYIAQGIKRAALEKGIDSGGIDERLKAQLSSIQVNLDGDGNLPLEQRLNLVAVQNGEGHCTIAVTQSHRRELAGPGVITTTSSEVDPRSLLSSSDRPLILILGDNAPALAEQISQTMAAQGRQFTIEPYETLYPAPVPPPPHPTTPGVPATPQPPHGQPGLRTGPPPRRLN